VITNCRVYTRHHYWAQLSCECVQHFKRCHKTTATCLCFPFKRCWSVLACP
jgi:hypothetical protein